MSLAKKMTHNAADKQVEKLKGPVPSPDPPADFLVSTAPPLHRGLKGDFFSFLAPPD